MKMTGTAYIMTAEAVADYVLERWESAANKEASIAMLGEVEQWLRERETKHEAGAYLVADVGGVLMVYAGTMASDGFARLVTEDVCVRFWD